MGDGKKISNRILRKFWKWKWIKKNNGWWRMDEEKEKNSINDDRGRKEERISGKRSEE